MSCQNTPGPAAVRELAASCLGAHVTADLFHAARQSAGGKQEHPKAVADPDQAVSAIRVMLKDLGIHPDAPGASDLITRVELGELQFTQGQAEALRVLGPALVDKEKASGRSRCSQCGRFTSPDDPDHGCTPGQAVGATDVAEGKRTDIHRPSSPDFDPQAYLCKGVFANSALYSSASVKARKQAIAALVSDGYKFGHGSSESCGHCGHRIGYGALMVRGDVKEFIFVGEDCLDNRFELTMSEFQDLRKDFALNKHRENIKQVRQDFLSAHPDLANLNEHDHYILNDMATRLHRDGTLSDAQVALARKVIIEQKERKAAADVREQQRQALLASGVKAPTGATTFTGEIVSEKYIDSDYGTQHKMLVKAPEGWVAWMTVPKEVAGIESDLRGKSITLTVDLTPKQDDPLFAYGKRPRKSKLQG